MRSLEELKSIDDGGSFDRLVKKVEEAVDGDESLKLQVLTEAVLRGFIRKATESVQETQTNFGVEFVNLSFRIPKKIRIKVPPPNDVSCVNYNIKDSLDKKRKADSSSEEEEKKKNKRTSMKKNILDDQQGLNPPPQLPQEFKDRIEGLNGTDVTLVIQKELTRTDMDACQARFAMPRGQVKTHGFLSEEEIHILSQKGLDGIQCSLIQPCLEETTNFELKRWKMDKTFSYALIKNWNSVADNTRNHLHVGSKVQLWSFRVGSQLWFALVKL